MKFIVEQSTVNRELINYLDHHYKKYELGPVITADKLCGNVTYVIRSEGRIAAAMCISDTMNVKQNVVMKMKWNMKLMLGVVNLFRTVLNISPMPVVDRPVKMLYVKYLVAEDNDPALVKAMIDFARNVAYEKRYSFVSIGLHERDLLNECLPPNMRLKFYSKGMLLSVKNNHEIIMSVKNGIPFEDYSLV